MTLDLGPRQKTTVGVAITVLSAAVILAAAAFFLFTIGIFFRAFSHVFLPVAVAGVAALVFKPYYDWLLARRPMPAIVALAIVFLSILAPIVGVSWFFGALLVDQLTGLLAKLPTLWDEASKWFAARWPEIVLFFEEHAWGVRIREALVEQQPELVEGLRSVASRALLAGAGVARTFAALAAWIVLPVYFAYFLMATPSKSWSERDVLPFLKEETRRDVIFLAREFVGIVVTFFRGQLLIAFCQGVLFAIGFSAVGLSYGALLGLTLGFLNLVPYLGSIIGLASAIPLAFFQPGGGLGLAIAVVVVFAAVQTIEGYVLTPKIMGDRTGLHPMVIMIAIFFWGSALGGILGMILAIPLTAFLVVLWRLATERYIRELV